MRTSSIYQLKVSWKEVLPFLLSFSFTPYNGCLHPDSFLSIIWYNDWRDLNAMSVLAFSRSEMSQAQFGSVEWKTSLTILSVTKFINYYWQLFILNVTFQYSGHSASFIYSWQFFGVSTKGNKPYFHNRPIPRLSLIARKRILQLYMKYTSPQKV